MRGEETAEQTARRLDELAERAGLMGRACFTGFLSPPEAEWALIAGRKQGVRALLSGGYEDAERRVACFVPQDGEAEPFPIVALELTWPHQAAPEHRDVLGSVMGLGIKRQCVGDIVMEPERAFLFVQSGMGTHVMDALLSAGRTRLSVRAMEELPSLAPPKGTEVRDTVLSPRLDAVLGAGLCLSRAKAAELITSGNVKLRHLPTLRTDAQVKPGDAISVRGYGRLVLSEVGAPTKKGRLPLLLLRYGEHHGR
ncbi:MAG: YlmH/Sll1252 family protein [Clostridia bacterium]